MVKAHISDYSSLNLEFLHICLVQNLKSCIDFIRSQNPDRTKKIYCIPFMIDFICLRNILDRPETSGLSFNLPFTAVSVSFKHDILSL